MPTTAKIPESPAVVEEIGLSSTRETTTTHKAMTSTPLTQAIQILIRTMAMTLKSLAVVEEMGLSSTRETTTTHKAMT